MSEDNSIASTELLTASVAEAPIVAEVVATPAENNSFMENISPELRKEKSLQSFKDAEGLAKSYVELNKKFGKRLEDLTADEIRVLDKKFGAPESVDEYGITLPEEMKSDPVLNNIGKDFLDAGIPKDKANKLMATVMNKITESHKMAETEMKLEAEANVKTLRAEFGSAFDERILMANKALTKFGGPEAIDAIIKSGLSSNPALVKMFAEVGKLIAEDKAIGDNSARSFGITPEEASAKIAELESDPAFLDRLRNRSHPGHEEATSQREKLYRLKAGKK